MKTNNPVTPVVYSLGDKPGHFIAADRCKFIRHHHISGKYCISTVGEFHPGSRYDNRLGLVKDKDFVEEIGFDRSYETMVFEITGPCKHADPDEECECPHGGICIDSAGYNTEVDAERGHKHMLEAMIAQA